MNSPYKIPYVDLGVQHAAQKKNILRAIERVIDHGKFILGPEVEAFESEFARLCGTKYAVGLNSGTDALHLGLKVLGIGAGDEVITPPNSFVASTSAIMLAGATPVFADVRDDYTIDPVAIEAVITKNTKAIMPVHLSGRPCQMDAIMKIAQEHKLAVVEDCAQAVLAVFQGRCVGSFGAVGCFSLHPLKTLNAIGDGGIVTTDDEQIARRLRVSRNIGLPSREDCTEWSGNSRLDTVQAAVLLTKLPSLREWTDARVKNAAHYRESLASISALTIPVDDTRGYSVYHTFVVMAENRDNLREYLALQGIETAVHYPTPIHLMTIGRSLGYDEGSFPVTENQAKYILSLPIHQDMRRDDIEQVCSAIRAFYA